LQRSQHVGVRGCAGYTVKNADEMLNRVRSINNANIGALMPGGLNATRHAGRSGSDSNRGYMRSQIEVGELLKNTFSE
jgi:hypothetical protein